MLENSEKNGILSRNFNFYGIVILIIVLFGLIIDTTKADNNNFYSDIIRLDNVATRIHQNYVEEINSENLVDKAVEGMLDILDPHTSFFKKKEYEELRIHTEGKFGGLGIQISIREKVLTVMTPISGTPASRAGIQSGDQIIQIDSKNTEGITIDEAVAILRGEPGSDVNLKINRKGESKLLEFTITRDVISIKSVPYYGVLDNNIGYLRLTTFSQEASDEVEKNIKKLLKKNIEGLVLDLRHNPGGLLPQAIEVSEKFLDRKSLVVSTRGRVSTQNKDFHASANPILPKDIPLVILVNSASASASEIVAGAIQDWDRGVILGDTTFGKGSVQSILPLDKDHHLKLTTAFYYTPSGRCINKAENDVPNSIIPGENGRDGIINGNKDLKTDSDSIIHYSDSTRYLTNSGRLVYGGGGIIPDTIVQLAELDEVIRALYLKDIFFKFANIKYPQLQKEKITIDSSFSITKKILNDFYTFLDSVKFEFKSYSRTKFEEYQKISGLIKDTASDSGGVTYDLPNWNEKELGELKDLSAKIENIMKTKEKSEFQKSETKIKEAIREAFLIRGLGQDNSLVYKTKLSSDSQVQAAVALLSDKKIYTSLLQPPKKQTATFVK
ncbi:MAG: S41 family peptidase [Chitinispirillia bacterium]